jgi:5'-3' exonuclease
MNLIIDGNAFLNVAVSIVKNILANDKRIGEKYYVADLLNDDKFILKQGSKDSFKSFSTNYFGSILAPFKENIQSVFFVFDSKSWRKKYIKEHFETHGEGDFNYKGQRKYDDKIYLFFEYFQNEILNIISDEYGVVVNRVPGAEGDDLIAYICENLNEDICIWSVDKDLTQLLESNKRKVILIMPKQMTKYKKIYTTADFGKDETPAEVNLFDFDIEAIDNSAVINIINDLTQKDYQHLTIDPTLDILTKCLAGDSSDNIPRVHPKMTASKVSKIIEYVRESYEWSDVKDLIDSGDSGFLDVMREITCDTLKIKEPGEWQTIENNIHRNKTLVRLSTKLFPTDVLDAIKASVDLTVRRKFNYYKFKKNYKY